MKSLLFLVSFLILPFLPTTVAAQYGDMIVKARTCFRSAYGINIKAFEGRCPSKKYIDNHTKRLMKRVGAGRTAFSDLTVVFTEGEIFPIKVGTVIGLTPDKHHVVIRYYEGIPTAETFCHELGHILLKRAKLWSGYLHYSYDPCPTDESPDAEACELLDAFEAWYTDKLMLEKDSRFLEAFSKL